MNGSQESPMLEGVQNVKVTTLIGIESQKMTSEIPYGYCHCGCGQKTKICTHTIVKSGYKLNEPMDFIRGHAIRGSRNPAWKGGRKTDKDGYRMISSPNHPNRNSHGNILEHVLVCEKALGKYLPKGAVVHHVDKRKNNNFNSNLVICQDNTYHLYLHQRLRAYKASGHANWLRCRYCKEYDDPKNMTVRTYNNHSYAEHNKCNSEYQRKSKLARKMKGEMTCR